MDLPSRILSTASHSAGLSRHISLVVTPATPSINLDDTHAACFPPWSPLFPSSKHPHNATATTGPFCVRSSSATSGSGSSSTASALEIAPLSQNGGVFSSSILSPHPPEKSRGKNLAPKEELVSLLRVGGLDTQRMSYVEKFLVRCYEVGMNRTASIETIANLLQEVACNHAQSVGFSTDGFATTPTMRKMRLIWVTTRMHIEVNEYPAWGDVVEVETWCQSEGKVGTRRDWLIMNAASGKTIGRATSTWVMMNQDTRRLARVTDDIRSEYLIYCPDPPRWAFPDENDCSVKKIPKLEDPTQYLRSGLMPRRGDLDMNQHVNNVTYIGWILESTPQEIIDTHELHTITLDYRRECKHGDLVESLASLESESNDDLELSYSPKEVNGFATESSLQFLHMLQLASSHIEINRGRTKWRKKVGN